MLLQTLLFVIGLAGLLFGADVLVRGSANLARGLGISQMMIGLTVVAIGTSTPELAVSVLAALQGNSDIAVGNVVGSNISNIGLILGATALVRPVPVARTTLLTDIPAMIIAAILVAVLAMDARLARGDALILLAGCALYLGFMLRAALKDPATSREEIEIFDPSPPRDLALPPNLLRIIAGLALLVVGARLLVDAASFVARELGLSDLVIGLTVVAIGTSLPELATSVTAARRGHSDLALGNVVGSNILNILLILGVTALIHPLSARPALFTYEIPVMLGFSVLMIPLAVRGSQVTRAEGAFLVLAYAAFLVILLVRGAV